MPSIEGRGSTPPAPGTRAIESANQSFPRQESEAQEITLSGIQQVSAEGAVPERPIPDDSTSESRTDNNRRDNNPAGQNID